jgi:small-conductance mechanosensitive channel
MSGLAAGVLSPFRRPWRLFTLPDRVAVVLWRTVRAIAALVAIAKVTEALQSAIVASLPLTIATKGLFSLLVVARLVQGLRAAFRTKIDEKTGEIQDRAGSHWILPRLIGWGVAATVFFAAMFGYVALARFIVEQVIWLLILALASTLVLVLIEETIGSGLSSGGALGRRVREATGLTAGSLDQMSVLGSGAARLVVYVSVVMLALAPWGVDSSDLFGNLRAAFFGFDVGGVTISLSTIALALMLFLIGILITKAIQNWLDTHYLPHTGLDIGLRNSIKTIFGYVGVIIAASLALGQAGFSLDKITIVAGALSLGIGFGLQSIVGNFVSGLILLWERPIRVGDWIVVGDEQGTVKRINVRATEIQTFDRASLIVPNSEFISGRVKNWMHSDRTGRIIIPINVDYQSDPDEVEKLLREAALANREVMSEPAPIIIFKNLGESGLDFELRCFCDVDAMLTTRSELLFDIFRRLRAAKIDVPYPTRRLEITNMPGMASGASFITTERPPASAAKGPIS